MGLYWKRATTQGAIAVGGRRASRSGCCSSRRWAARRWARLPGPAGRPACRVCRHDRGSLAPQVLRNRQDAAQDHRRGLTAASAGHARLGPGLRSGPPPIIEGFAPLNLPSHAHLRLQMRLLWPCQGRAAKNLRRAADGVPGLRRCRIHQAAHRRRFPAQGLRLVRHRFPGGSGAAAPRRLPKPAKPRRGGQARRRRGQAGRQPAARAAKPDAPAAVGRRLAARACACH